MAMYTCCGEIAWLVGAWVWRASPQVIGILVCKRPLSWCRRGHILLRRGSCGRQCKLLFALHGLNTEADRQVWLPPTHPCTRSRAKLARSWPVNSCLSDPRSHQRGGFFAGMCHQAPHFHIFGQSLWLYECICGDRVIRARETFCFAPKSKADCWQCLYLYVHKWQSLEKNNVQK